MSHNNNRSVEEIYQKKTPLEHVLLRPDTYVGSIEKEIQTLHVVDVKEQKMVEEKIEFVPALYKIFDEILVNAADNKQRDSKMKEIRVVIDREAGYISIKNDGKGIPIEIHKKHKMYVPELIFGNLLTSSNYNDADNKTTGGRNGFGAKLANIFSKKFILETVDHSKKKRYTQIWENNMGTKSDPEITAVSSKTKDFTKVTFFPDFGRFKMEGFEDGIIKLFIKRVYDIAGCSPRSLNVHLRVKPDGIPDAEYDHRKGGLLPVKNIHIFIYNSASYITQSLYTQIKTFIDYVKMYIGKSAISKTDYFYHTEDRWEVVLAVSEDGDYRQCSHVNSIWTIKGGSHVRNIEGQFTRYFKDNFKTKDKKMKAMLKPRMIKDFMFVFVNCLIVNPAFSSQTKETLTTKPKDFGSKCVLPTDLCKRLMNKLKDRVSNLLEFKMGNNLKKSDGKKKRKLNLNAEIDDCNHSGGRYSQSCTLIVTEGLSAKTLAVAGIAAIDGGKDKYGIFPLRGKMLNVREASSLQVLKNNEIIMLKKTLGLVHKANYDDDAQFNQLRYGKIMIMTDQDYDGSHIKGLLINFIQSEWPALIRREGFIQQFITPIVVCTSKRGSKKKKKIINFYTIPQFEQWKGANHGGRGYVMKYYKGLGTWKNEDGIVHFQNIDKNRIFLQYEGKKDDEKIEMAFTKKKVEERKAWLRAFKKGTFLDFNKPYVARDNNSNNTHHQNSEYINYNVNKYNPAQKRVSFVDFVDRELILFSRDDNGRSIPSLVDGFKPGQRKIMYCCFLRNLKKEIRVAQLGGYVSEKSAYHHGEVSLYQTIIGMAQDFVGSNNINLLMPEGNFGTRLKGGKDASSPRYVHTRLAPIARVIFNENDGGILNYLEDDGFPVEPSTYFPIIPMVLVNGAEGIGTGWSTSIPNYNPRDIINNLFHKLAGEPMEIMTPWYRGFTGDIAPNFTHKVNAELMDKIEDSPDQTLNIMIQQHMSHPGNTPDADVKALNASQCWMAYNIYGNMVITERAGDRRRNTGMRYATAEITELPIRSWSEVFKKYLLDLELDDQIFDVSDLSSTTTINYKFSVEPKVRRKRARKKPDEDNNNAKKIKTINFYGEVDYEFMRDMKLLSNISCTNMILFNRNGHIQKYNTVMEIMNEFFDVRMEAYHDRKKCMIAVMRHKQKKAENQMRFISLINERTLIVSKKKKLEIVQQMVANGLSEWKPQLKGIEKIMADLAALAADDEPDDEKKAEEAKYDSEDDDMDNDLETIANLSFDSLSGSDLKKLKKASDGYSYLLSMPIYSLTVEKVIELKKLIEKITKDIEELSAKSAKELWRIDLNDLLEALNKMDKAFDVAKNKKSKKKKKEKKAPAKKKRKRGKGRQSIEKVDNSDGRAALGKFNRGPPKKRKRKPKKQKNTMENYILPKTEKQEKSDSDSDVAIMMAPAEQSNKRKRVKIESSGDSIAVDLVQPPIKKRKEMVHKSTVIADDDSCTSSSSSSSSDEELSELELIVNPRQRPKRKRNVVIYNVDGESEDDAGDDGEEYNVGDEDEDDENGSESEVWI